VFLQAPGRLQKYLDVGLFMTYGHIRLLVAFKESPLPRTPTAERSVASPGAKFGRRERHRTETRERLFRAALRLFAEHGFAATTVEDITEAADVGKGTFFNYFPSKEHVFQAFADIQRGKVRRGLEEASRGNEPIRPLLHGLLHALAEEPGRSPALARSALVAFLSSEAVRKILLANMEAGRQELAQILAMGQKRGELRRDRKPLEMARMFQQTFFGALTLWAIDPRERLMNRVEASFPVLWSGMAGSLDGKEKRKHG